MENLDLSNISLGKFLKLKILGAEKNRLGIAVVLSVLFHLLLLVLVGYDVIPLSSPDPILPAVEEETRMVFEIGPSASMTGNFLVPVSPIVGPCFRRFPWIGISSRSYIKGT